MSGPNSYKDQYTTLLDKARNDPLRFSLLDLWNALYLAEIHIADLTIGRKCGPNGGLRAALADRAQEMEGYVSDDVRMEQKHLDAGTVERDYWHYGYLIALRDVLKRLDATGMPSKEQA